MSQQATPCPSAHAGCSQERHPAESHVLRVPAIAVLRGDAPQFYAPELFTVATSEVAEGVEVELG